MQIVVPEEFKHLYVTDREHPIIKIPADVLRQKGTPYAELQLGDPKWSDDQILDFIQAHPILMNRPIVETPKGTKLCRPSEAVLDLLDNPVNSFAKEDSEIVKR